MSYTYSFFDNQLIGVDELNKITSRFVTGGVARQPSSVSDINGFVADIATAGVVGNTSADLKVTLENGKIKINTGTAFFDNGTVIEVTEPELLDYTSGTAVNVYLKSDMNNNSIYPVVSESCPESEENIVHLAYVSPSGTVTDRRTYARGKCAYYYSSYNKSLRFSVTFTPEDLAAGNSKVIDIGSSDFTFMNVYGQNGSASWVVANLNYFFDENGKVSGVQGIHYGYARKEYYQKDDIATWGYTGASYISGDRYNMDLTVEASIADGKLTLTPIGILEGYRATFSITLC